MVLFVVMNTASFQLVPVTLTALRAAYGSAQPFGVLPQVWAVSLLGLGACVAVCKLWERTHPWEGLG